MKIELITQNNETGKTFDISNLIYGSINWETQLVDQPGKLTFEFIDEGLAIMKEGSPVSFKVDGMGVFFGYVFKRNRNQAKRIQVTAYDQLRYLKNKDTYVLPAQTASNTFTKICQDYKLRYKVVSPSSYVAPAQVLDNKSLFEIINYSLDRTLINAGEWYILRDNFGTLEFLNLRDLKTNLFIGDESLLGDYSFEKSIDEDTYNTVKLIKENKETQRREVYIVKDSSTIAKWGTLQYFEKINDAANDAQIRVKAEQLLGLKNRPTTTFKLNCLGDLKIFAGAGIVVGIQDLVVEGMPMNQYFLVTNCTHTFQNEVHMMQLGLKVVD